MALFRNEFLNTYLSYVEETESPRIFHVWSALSAISMCLGRRNFFPFGIGPIFPNQYVVLVGPPAVKKTTAMNIAVRLLKDATKIRWAPDDTAGQRQGLITAMKGLDEEEDNEIASILNEALTVQDGKVTMMNSQQNKIVQLSQIQLDTRDRHALAVAASELRTFVGTNSSDMLTFLLKVWDGEEYKYQLKKDLVVLKDPLLNLISCTTPVDIAEALPAAAIGRGFMSRMILVFGDKKYKNVPRPAKLDEKKAQFLKEVFGRIFNNFEGPFSETTQASRMLDELYNEELKVKDPRFVYYSERRQTHLIKLIMAVTASRLSKTIETQDIQEAAQILRFTEQYMPDALGQYGLSPLSLAKQKMVDFIKAANEPIKLDILWAVMNKDMRLTDFKQAVADLINSKAIMEVQTKYGQALIEVSKKQTVFLDEILDELIDEEQQEKEQKDGAL